MHAAGGTTRRRRVAWVTGTAIALLAALLPVTPAAAHGDLDQASGGSANEPCSMAEYPGSKLITSGESRQSFVPVLPGLTSVDLCIQNLVGTTGTDFTVKIYRKGENGAADVPVETKAQDAGTNLLAAQWVHVDFDRIVPTTPGTAYVLGVTPAAGTNSSVSFQWRSTCDGALASCDLLYTGDKYPAGSTNDLPGNADYGFRTFTPPIGDLVANASVSRTVCPGLDLTGRATGTVFNGSSSAVGPFATQWLWSADNVAGAGDRVLPGSRTDLPGLAAGATATIAPPRIPSDQPYGAGYLLLQADVDNTVRELDDTNNVAAPATMVTSCLAPTLTSLDLTVAEDTIATGFNEVQFDDLPARALATLPQTAAETTTSPAFQPNGFSPNGFSPNGFSPNAFSSNGFAPNGFSPNGFSPNGFSPNGFSPNGFSPNGFSPNGFSPAGGVLLSSVLDDLPPALVQAAHVVDIPIVDPGWESRLPQADVGSIQEVTLAKASALLPNLRLDEVDLTRVLTSSWMALALANAPLNSVPMDWCGLLVQYGSSCAGLGVDPAATSLLGLEGAGFPGFQAPIAGRTLASLTPDPRWLVMGLPLSGQRSFHLGLTDLGQLAADEALTSPSAIVDCAAFDCDQPLFEAQEAGAIRNVTVRDLVAALSDRGRSVTTLGDLAMGTSSLGSLRLSAANWNLADPHEVDAACPRAQYRLTGTNAGPGTAVDPTATVTLPAGFAYVPGTAVLSDDGAAGVAQAEPSSTVTGAGVRTYTFVLDAAIDSRFTLTFAACAGEYLGAVDAGVARLAGEAVNGTYARSTTDATTPPDSVRVVERTPGVTTRPVASPDNVVIADHIGSAGEYDSWTFPVKTEPGTLYIVKLFPPAGVDYDLIAFGPASSSLSFNPNGFSPNGFSPNGFSPNGFSPNGFSPNGFSPNGFSPNGFSPNGFSSTAAPDLNDDVAIRELRPPSSSGVAVSANRGDTPETLHLVGRSGDAGNLTLSVADYNGTRSDAPYFLTIQTVKPTVDPRLAACATPPWDLAATPGTAPAPWTGTTPPRTLFVVNRQVTTSAYGVTDTTAGVAALTELAARPEVRGIVLNVDSDADVRAAYAGWRAKWCDPTAANVVATQVRRKILALRQQYPSIDTVVIGGGDELVPDFRLDDRSAMANEDQYTDALLRAARTNNPLVATYANGMIPSADPYGNEGPLPFGMSFAFPPSAGVSRLVETPRDWVVQRDQYVLSGGALNPSDAFVSAYDGMVDGAEAAAGALRSANLPTTVLSDAPNPWAASDFRTKAFASRFGGWNGHANHFGLLSDVGSATNDVAEQVTTAEDASIPLGSFVFSNGCHFGTAIDDLVNAAPTAAEAKRLRDWAQTITSRRGIAVANTGFGIFDTLEVGQGERLQQYFMEELNRSGNVSLALAKAKNRFFATPGVYDVYSYKTMHQLTVYGLGIFRMFGATTDPAPTPRPAATGAIPVSVGPYTVESATSTCTSCYRVAPAPAEARIELRDPRLETGHTSVLGSWSAPMSIRAVPLPQGKLPAGVWINGLASTTLPDRDVVHTRLAVDDPSREPEAQNAGPFPTAMSLVNAVGGTAYVNLMHGIAVPDRKSAAGKVVSDVHLYTSIDAELRLRNDTTTACRPTIASVTPTQVPGSDRIALDIFARETCGATTRAAALGRLSNGNWIYSEAVKTTDGHWLTGLVLPSGTTLEDLLVQVANDTDVAQWRFKGDRPVINQGSSDGVDLAFKGTQSPSGIFRSAVEATILGKAKVSYEVYDKDLLVGRYANGAVVPVAGDGPHELSVRGSDGSRAGRLVVIDTTSPVISWTTPAASGASYAWNDPVHLAVACADASGATCSITLNGAPTANGTKLTKAQGTYTVTVTAVDAVGNTRTESRTYTVRPAYTISLFASPIKARPNLNLVSPSSNLAIKFTIQANGVEQSDPSIITTRTWQAIDCTTKATTGAVFTTAGTAPGYTGGYFHFNTEAPAPLGCYQLVVTLADGTTQSAYFQVKR